MKSITIIYKNGNLKTRTAITGWNVANNWLVVKHRWGTWSTPMDNILDIL